MGSFREEYCSRLPFPFPGDLSAPGNLNPHLLHWQADSLSLSQWGSLLQENMQNSYFRIERELSCRPEATAARRCRSLNVPFGKSPRKFGSQRGQQTSLWEVWQRFLTESV